MVCNEVVDVAEKRHLVSPDYPNDFLYPVMKFFMDINRFSQPCRDVRFPDKQDGTEHGLVSAGHFPAETFAVGQYRFHYLQAKFPDSLVAGMVQVAFFPSVHHVPDELQTFDIALSGSYQVVLS